MPRIPPDDRQTPPTFRDQDYAQHFMDHIDFAQLFLDHEQEFRNHPELRDCMHQFHKCHVAIQPGHFNTKLQLHVRQVTKTSSFLLHTDRPITRVSAAHPTHRIKSAIRAKIPFKTRFHATVTFSLNLHDYYQAHLVIWSIKHHHQSLQDVD
jgi:hypothetical protein